MPALRNHICPLAPMFYFHKQNQFLQFSVNWKNWLCAYDTYVESRNKSNRYSILLLSIYTKSSHTDYKSLKELLHFCLVYKISVLLLDCQGWARHSKWIPSEKVQFFQDCVKCPGCRLDLWYVNSSGNVYSSVPLSASFYHFLYSHQKKYLPQKPVKKT